MDITQFIPSGPLMAWFPAGSKGFEVQIRYLSPGDQRRMARESVDLSKGKPSFSDVRHELIVFAAAVQAWRGLTIDALAELVPGLDMSAAAYLSAGHQFPFNPETLKLLTDHSPEFYKVVNVSCCELAGIRARMKEEELKNSATAQDTSSGPAQSDAEGVKS